MNALEASATTAGTARHVREVLHGTCPMGHALAGHTYAVIASVPLPVSRDDNQTVLDAVRREDWTQLTKKFGFAAGKSLDVIALRCPDEALHLIVAVSAHDPYDADIPLEQHRVNDPQNLLACIPQWDSFDEPRAIRTPAGCFPC